MDRSRHYFDNAATSSPKPPAVLRAMSDYADRLGGSPGRGAYHESVEAGRLMQRCRTRINALIGGAGPDQVVFALNTSDALNTAIKGLLLPPLARDPRATVHAVTTWLDHNSVLRPLNALAALFPGRVRVTRVRPDPATGVVDPDEIARAVRSDAETRLVAVNHASNVTGIVQPVRAIGAACRELGVPFLVDAAQSLGHIPVDVRADSVDLLAFPGHKGLLGPTGTGGLYIRPGMERHVAPLREGGTGSRSELDVHPETMPDRYEPGSQNAIGIIGLSEGVEFLRTFEQQSHKGVPAVRAHELELIEAFRPALEIPGLRLLGPDVPAASRVGVFTFAHEALDPHAIAMLLESEFGVLTRAGLHCAPLAHRLHAAQDDEIGGGVRFSVGPFLTVDDVRFAVSALRQVCAGAAPVATLAGQARRTNAVGFPA
ncbi:MAG: aminotransferase class V-fold PLP-dependent enzyme [Planctomycetota bacterium]|nr:aminotransferase class V-fold PLP-dependent enzyme [Planctomycetota bacterium]